MSDNNEVYPVPGYEVAGRFVYLRPRQPYELKERVFNAGDEATVYYSRQTGKSYSLPAGYEVNDSPPLPENRALNQTMIEESWDSFGKQINESAKVAASSAVFSIDTNASQIASLKSNREAYYALRNSFLPLWCVYVPDCSRFPKTIFDLDSFPIPWPFNHKDRDAYTRFFQRYGSHYVKRVWVGGKATLAFIVEKSTEVSKDEIQAGIKASFGLGKGEASANLQTSRDKLLKNSVCHVFGAGGDETLLAKLSSLDEAQYNKWLDTIQENPQVIEIEMAGVWTLFDDPDKAAALQEAYKEEIAFKPISAICTIKRQVYFLRDGCYFAYDLDKRKPTEDRLLPVTNLCLELDKEIYTSFKWPDTAFTASYLYNRDKISLQDKIYLFKRDRVIRVDIETRTVDPGYPKLLEEEWPGLGFTRVDAILNTSPNAVYFFKGSQYVRYEMSEKRYGVFEGYPKPTKDRWIGVVFDRIDAAIYWRFDKAYFFSDDQYIRYDLSNYRVDAGYPKAMPSNYIQDWESFD